MGQPSLRSVYPAKAKPPSSLIELADQIEADGGTALALYQEPVGHQASLRENVVLARVSPLSGARRTLPDYATAFRKLADRIEAFDPDSLRMEDITRAVGSGGGG